MLHELFVSAVGITVLVSIFCGGIIYVIYTHMTKFKITGPIVHEYEPYPGIQPLYAGFLINKRLDPRDITAGIMHLVVQGFIKVRRIEGKTLFLFEVDDYEMTLTRNIEEIDDVGEQKIAMLIFFGKTPVGTKTTLHELKNIYTNSEENKKLFLDLEWHIRRQLVRRGYLFWFNPEQIFFKLSLYSMGILVVIFFIIPSAHLFFILFVIIFAFLQVLLILATDRRTRKGYKALHHLNGFKDYLKVTESERYKFHNAPQKSPEQFMEFLPYAIAFGVEKQWAEVFAVISDLNPTWYDHSDLIFNFDLFSISQSIGGFSTAFAASSGTSALSGGGSSEGESGGGGS